MEPITHVMPGVVSLLQLIIALFFIFLGIYGIKNRKISKKGSKLMIIGIILLLICGFVFWQFVVAMVTYDLVVNMVSFYMFLFFSVTQLLLTYGAFKNYRAYEKKLADRLRGIF